MLEGEHFDYWNNQTKTLFLFKNVWDIVEDGFPEPPPQQTKVEAWS